MKQKIHEKTTDLPIKYFIT